MRQLQWVNETRHHTRAERDGILAFCSAPHSPAGCTMAAASLMMQARIQAEAPVLYGHLQCEAGEYSIPIAEFDWLT